MAKGLASVHRHHRPLLRACRLLDGASKELWQQQERTVNGSPSVQTWVERQRTASRWEMNHSNAGRVGSLLKEELWHSESTTAGSTPTSSVASLSSFASTRADLAPTGHGRLSRGRDGANSAEQQVSQSDGHASSLKQNHVTTEHFDMSVDDWLEVEEGFFPGDCPVTRQASNRPVIDCS